MKEPSDVIPETFELLPDVGYNRHLGKVYAKVEDQANGSVCYLFDPSARHCGIDNQVHDGVLMSIADSLLGASVGIAVGGRRCSTMTINCDLLGICKPGQRLIGKGSVTRQTSSIVFVSGQLEVEGRTILKASGVWKILGEH